MTALFAIFLFLHIAAAIIAFGPTFAFPLIASAGQKHPQHAAFAAEINEKIERVLVVPLALSMPVSGAGMIIFGGVDLFQPWLLAAIVIYVVAIGYSMMIQGPAGKELAQLLQAMTASPGPGAARAEAAGGPPPRLLELGAQMKRGGMILTVLLVAILALMVIGAETNLLG
jgi:uncharacterized membrane protein